MSNDEYTPTVEEWIAANTVPCAADGVEHDCAYDFLHVEVESARAFIAVVERAAAVKALRPIAEVVAPIIARVDPEQIGTHSVNCHEYHVGCLALAVQQRIERGESA
jgi:hypothetical protein